MNYYRRYSGDYLKKTARLSILEHGAYSLLLDYYYTDEEPLPADHEEIYRIVRALSPPERKAIDKVLGLYFALRADGYHNERADEEIAIAQPAIEAARINGKLGGRPPKNRAHKPPGIPEENPPGYRMDEPTGLGTGIEPPTTILQPPAFEPPTPNPEPKSVARKRAAPAKTALPDGFSVSERVRKWADEKGFSRLDEHLENFVGKARAKGYTYADWDEGFMGAIRDDWAGLRGGKSGGHQAAFDEAERRIFGAQERDITDEAKRL